MKQAEKRTPEGFRLQKWERADTDIVPIQPGDSVQRVLETGIQAIRRYHVSAGNVPAYANTEDGLQKFREVAERYFQDLYEYNSALEEGTRGVLPDIEGFCIFAGISRVTLGKYLQRGGAWEAFILFLKDCIAAARKQAASEYKSPPVFEIFNLKCNSDYIEKSELKVTASTETTEEQLQDAIDAHGLKWNAESGEYEPVEEGASYDT